MSKQDEVKPVKIYTTENSLKWEQKDSLPDFIARPVVLEIVVKLSKQGMKSILDIGCGTGRWTKIFSKDLPEVVGLDSVKAMIDICNERNTAPNISYIFGDMFDLHGLFQNKKFDIITALSVIQYSKDKSQLYKLCRDIYDSLNVGGHFVFWSPHPFAIISNTSNWDTYQFDENSSYFSNFPFTGKIKLTDGDWKNVGANFHSVSEYLNALSNAGFKITQIYEPAVGEELLKKYPDLEPDSRYPSCLVVDAVKPG